MFRRIRAANILGKGFISCLCTEFCIKRYRGSRSDSWEQKQMEVWLSIHKVHLFTTKMRDGWHFLLRVSPFQAVFFLFFICTQTSHYCIYTKWQLQKCYLMSSSTLSRKREFLFHLNTKTATSASKDRTVVAVVFADKSRSACLLKEAWR